MRITVAGARGFLGSHVGDCLGSWGIEGLAIGRQDVDLREPGVAEFQLREADTIIHLAADFGGVAYLKSRASRAFHGNRRLGITVIPSARRSSGCFSRTRNDRLRGSRRRYDRARVSVK
jgi:nucleoside-diphosphate-sugar epimerase